MEDWLLLKAHRERKQVCTLRWTNSLSGLTSLASYVFIPLADFHQKICSPSHVPAPWLHLPSSCEDAWRSLDGWINLVSCAILRHKVVNRYVYVDTSMIKMLGAKRLVQLVIKWKRNFIAFGVFFLGSRSPKYLSRIERWFTKRIISTGAPLGLWARTPVAESLAQSGSQGRNWQVWG